MNNYSGIYLAQKKWNLIYLSNKKIKFEEYMNYSKFIDLLYKNYMADVVKRIEEAINTEKKVILDFNNHTAKLVKDNDLDFFDYFKSYFSKDAVLEWLNEQNQEDSY